MQQRISRETRQSSELCFLVRAERHCRGQVCTLPGVSYGMFFGYRRESEEIASKRGEGRVRVRPRESAVYRVEVFFESSLVMNV